MSHGELDCFKIKPFLDVVDILVNGDEVERALWLLDNLPGYYRDNEPLEITQARHDIQRKLMTPSGYMGNKQDQIIHVDSSVTTLDYTLRGNLIQRDVKKLNDEHKIPHIIDLGPGEYWVPLSLMKKGFKFTYWDLGLSEKAREMAFEVIRDYVRPEPPLMQPVIFLACELIEHLWNPKDILSDYLRCNVEAEIIHLSTPKYAFDGGCTNWREQREDLGHLRTYTPHEFCNVVAKLFKNYDFKYYDHEVMHLRGRPKGKGD